MRILAVDTSCDETSAAVLHNDRVISNVISSQVDLHKKWGGVVPDIARRAHNERIDPVIREALARSRTTLETIDYFSATYGPGLAIALEVGLKHIQALALEHGKPFIPINHMEGHLLSPFARNAKGNHPLPPPEKFPLIGLLVSGGHTELVLTHDFGNYARIGSTLDDAAGEAFDKVAKMLELGYPGGPVISEFAKKGKPGRFPLPVPMEHSNDLNFSFSGLKTACLYRIREIRQEYPLWKPRDWVYDFCADFVRSVTLSLVLKLEGAVDHYSTVDGHSLKGILLGGGVMSNKDIRSAIRQSMRKRNIPVYQPYSTRLYTDNAAMIGTTAYYSVRRSDPAVTEGQRIKTIERDPVAEISSR
ncbi:MAG: tRNA (adenosine(37)-N6)-threonylcarbamoyltransferase complex transferase subunit TsaD [Candidatus Dojkabacteria bacterium]|nr:tRNA (adenosine(37)-N6)-threonylcarbamoyltransferase complex transferase subunit TsaD [Candidatus Dojkabacteria bacterium]